MRNSTMKIVSHLVTGVEAVAIITPDKLKQLAFVSTYSAHDPQSSSPQKRGYQREPMAERFPGIGRYYLQDDNRHHIPFIIVSVRAYTAKSKARFNKLFNMGEIAQIHKEFGKSVFSIVDGQHRMGGLFWVWEHDEDFNIEIPVTLYYGLSYREEAKLFDDINTNQRKLPKALIEATLVHTQQNDESHAQKLRVLTQSLAQDKDSVWQDLVNMTGAEKDKSVTFSTLIRATGTLLPERLAGRLKARKLDPTVVAKTYWKMVSEACYEAWAQETEDVKYRLRDVVGVSAVSRLGQDILGTALDTSETEEEFWIAAADLVSKLSEVNWRKDRSNPYAATSAGFGGSSHLYSLIYSLVYSGEAPGAA